MLNINVQYILNLILKRVIVLNIKTVNLISDGKNPSNSNSFLFRCYYFRCYFRFNSDVNSSDYFAITRWNNRVPTRAPIAIQTIVKFNFFFSSNNVEFQQSN